MDWRGKGEDDGEKRRLSVAPIDMLGEDRDPSNRLNWREKGNEDGEKRNRGGKTRWREIGGNRLRLMVV